MRIAAGCSWAVPVTIEKVGFRRENKTVFPQAIHRLMLFLFFSFFLLSSSTSYNRQINWNGETRFRYSWNTRSQLVTLYSLSLSPLHHDVLLISRVLFSTPLVSSLFFRPSLVLCAWLESVNQYFQQSRQRAKDRNHDGRKGKRKREKIATWKTKQSFSHPSPFFSLHLLTFFHLPSLSLSFAHHDQDSCSWFNQSLTQLQINLVSRLFFLSKETKRS